MRYYAGFNLDAHLFLSTGCIKALLLANQRELRGDLAIRKRETLALEKMMMMIMVMIHIMIMNNNWPVIFTVILLVIITINPTIITRPGPRPHDIAQRTAREGQLDERPLVLSVVKIMDFRGHFYRYNGFSCGEKQLPVIFFLLTMGLLEKKVAKSLNPLVHLYLSISKVCHKWGG